MISDHKDIPDWLAARPAWTGPGEPKVVHLTEEQYAAQADRWRGTGFAAVRPVVGPRRRAVPDVLGPGHVEAVSEESND